MKHQAEVFREDATGEWGWQCLTCGAEETGLDDLDAAEEARDRHLSEVAS